MNKGWCTNCSVVGSHCSEAVEHLIIKCRPHYLLRKFTAVLIIAVYVPPHANATAALKELHDTINTLQNKYPEALYVVAGDFNHVWLRDTLPTFQQHVKIATRGNNTLDKVYTNRRETYRAFPHPHLGSSDHISIMLAPAYCPVLKNKKATEKDITVWPSGAISMLQDCFECTDWQMFKEATTVDGKVNLEEYTTSVLAYIRKCTDDVIIKKNIRIPPNQKPWLNAEVRSLLRARDAAFRSGDSDARRSLTMGIKTAKSDYALKIQGHFTSNDPRSMWKGIKCVTNYSKKNAKCPTDPALPDALNHFYARFEASNNSPTTKLTSSPGDYTLSVSEREVALRT